MAEIRPEINFIETFYALSDMFLEEIVMCICVGIVATFVAFLIRNIFLI